MVFEMGFRVKSNIQSDTIPASVSEMSAMGRQAVFIMIMIVCISSILIYTNNTSFLRTEIPHLFFRCKKSSSAVMVLLILLYKNTCYANFLNYVPGFLLHFTESYDKLTMVRKT